MTIALILLLPLALLLLVLGMDRLESGLDQRAGRDGDDR
jgi:hypothetical protein